MLPFIMHANKQLILEQTKKPSPGRWPCFWSTCGSCLCLEDLTVDHTVLSCAPRGDLSHKGPPLRNMFGVIHCCLLRHMCAVWFECQLKVITCCQAGRNESHMAQCVHIWPSSLRGARQLAFMCSCNCSFRASVGVSAVLQDESSKPLSAFMEKLKLHSYRERRCGIACTHWEIWIIYC